MKYFLCFIFIIMMHLVSHWKVFSQPLVPYFGINLAGAEFGSIFPGTYNSTYTYPTYSEIAYYRSKNFRLIRLPFRWERIQHGLSNALDSAELNRILGFCDSAAAQQVYVLLDMHNSGRYQFSNGHEDTIGSVAVPSIELAKVWQKIALVFNSHPAIYGYGIMNEPHDMLSSPTWFQIAQEAIDSIRTIDTSTHIFVGGNSWSSAEYWPIFSDSLKYLQDPANKIYSERSGFVN